jgi:hypothetical protein
VEAQVRPEPQIYGPYTHDNLSVFLIHANRDRIGQGHPQVCSTAGVTVTPT